MMNIHPNDPDKKLKERFSRFIDEAVDHCTPEHDRAEDNEAYLEGSGQWLEDDLEAMRQSNRPALRSNEIVHSVGLVSGRATISRFRAKLAARNEEGEWHARNFDELYRWERDQAESEFEESLVFRSTVTCGYGVRQKYWDPLARDGEGMIRDQHRHLWEVVWDPEARRINLTDRCGHALGRWVPDDELIAQYEGVRSSADPFFERLSQGRMGDVKDSGVVGRWAWRDIAGGSFYDPRRRETFVIEWEYEAVAQRYVVAAPITEQDLEALAVDQMARIELASGETLRFGDVSGIEARQLLPLLGQGQILTFETRAELDEHLAIREELGIPATRDDWTPRPRRVTRFAVLAGEHILDMGIRSWGSSLEFITCFPFAQRDKVTWFGLVDLAKDPQRFVNRFLSAGITQLGVSPKAPFIAEEGAFEDWDEMAAELADPGKPVRAADLSKIQPLPSPTFPDFGPWFSLAQDIVRRAVGVSTFEAQGQSDLRRISSKVVDSVRELSNATLSLPFLGLRLFRLRDVVTALEMMRELVDYKTLREIVGEKAAPAGEPRALPPPEEWPRLTSFELKIDESPVGEEERRDLWEGMTQTATWQEWVREKLVSPATVVRFMPGLTAVERQELTDELTQRDQIIQLLNQIQQDPEGAAVLQRILSGGAPAEQAPAADAAV